MRNSVHSCGSSVVRIAYRRNFGSHLAARVPLTQCSGVGINNEHHFVSSFVLGAKYKKADPSCFD